MTNDAFIDEFGAGPIVRKLWLPITAARVLALLTSVDPARAESVDRVYTACSATALTGEHLGACNIYLPPGKRFVITSATARGSLPSSQHVTVRLFTTVDGHKREHDFQALSRVHSNSWSKWSGVIPGVVWSDPGTIRFQIARGSSTTGKATFRLVLSGYLE